MTDMDGRTAFLETGDIIAGTAGVHAELLHTVDVHRPD